MLTIELFRNLNYCCSLYCKKKYKTYENQIMFIKTLHAPINDYQRSYNQYKCGLFVDEFNILTFAKNVISLFLLFFMFMYLYLKNKKISVDKRDIVLLINDELSSGYIPNSIIDSFDSILYPNMKLPLCIDNTDFKYYLKIYFKKPLSFMFNLKILIKLACYSYLIKKHKPTKIICSCEYSYTSSILTNYCELKEIAHINVMHGEKIFNIRDAFCRFTKFYVWDEYYIDLFKKLFADKSHFIVELPNCIHLDILSFDIKEEDICDYKFYLSLETYESLVLLRKVVDYLLSVEKKSIIRPHPLYTNIKLLYRFFSNNEIEIPEQIKIEKSIASAKNIVSIGSTVLFQAYNIGKPIIIDDITNVDRYNWFKDNKYIMFNKPHVLLSDILNEKIQLMVRK